MPGDVDDLLAGHIMLSFSTYVCAKYGDLRTPRLTLGGLSGWQKRVADEVLEAHIMTGVSLQYLASMCGLRVSQFAHAFKRTAGMAPYQWLQHRRIEKAKRLLRAGGFPIAEIAVLCGFSDQSHLNRIFRRTVGVSPAFWQLQRY